jgi:tRNA(fMet)-specific endonuclease VapC
MTIRFLLDSNMLSEPHRPNPNVQVLQQLERHRDEVAIASVVAHEMMYGCWRLPHRGGKTLYGNIFKILF